MEFGMFHEFPSLPGRTESEAFDEAIAQVDAAERLGLDVMWLAELHFEPRRSVLSAPLSIASAIAARTRRMKIGIAVQVLPLCHPLRLAEEAATVDQLSHGRLIFGVGRSGVAQTYKGLWGVLRRKPRPLPRNPRHRRTGPGPSRASRIAASITASENVAVVPKPYQKPTPPIRIAASTPDTFPAIGRRGAPIFASVRHTTWDDLPKQIRTYHDAWEEAGAPRPRAGLRLGADLYRRDRGARPRRAWRKASCISTIERANLLGGAAAAGRARKPPPRADAARRPIAQPSI